jgi:hypothetical protein
MVGEEVVDITKRTSLETVIGGRRQGECSILLLREVKPQMLWFVGFKIYGHKVSQLKIRSSLNIIIILYNYIKETH